MRATQRTYFILAERIDGRWGVAFGAFDRADVETERDDYRDHGSKARDLRVIKTLGAQSAIDAAIATMNAKGTR